MTIGDTFVRISGQGFPLVFVHGFTTTSEFWREQAEEFSKAYRVIRINLPGHGASPAPTSRSYCLEDFVEDVNRVFRELSIEKAILIGLSMGGINADCRSHRRARSPEAYRLQPDASADGDAPRQARARQISVNRRPRVTAAGNEDVGKGKPSQASRPNAFAAGCPARITAR